MNTYLQLLLYLYYAELTNSFLRHGCGVYYKGKPKQSKHHQA
jgi:hypothetical protein